MHCKSCGASLKSDARFCGKCGARADAVEPMGDRCPTCGTINRPGAKFCQRDGTPLVGAVPSHNEGGAAAASVAPTTASATSVETPVTTTEAVVQVAPPVVPSPGNPRHRPEPDEALGASGQSRWWLAIGTIVLLVAAGGGYWWYTGRGTPDDTADLEHAPAQPVPGSAGAGETAGDAGETPPLATTRETSSVDPSAAVQAPRVSGGDRWVTEVVDHQDATLNYRAERTVTDVGPDRIFTAVRTLGKDYVRVVEYTGEWALVATHLRSGATTDFSPALPYLDFPLQAGKSWEARVVETDAEGNRRVHEVRARVESWETVEVPAGTFRALKIVLTDDISKNGVAVLQGRDESWYSPEVKRTVKTEETSLDPATGERRRRTVSLVEYSVQQAGPSAAAQSRSGETARAQTAFEIDAAVGKWRWQEIRHPDGLPTFWKITPAGPGRFKLSQGSPDSADPLDARQVNWIEGTDDVYLTAVGGQLEAEFEAANFLGSTHAIVARYRVTIRPMSQDRLACRVWSNAGNGITEYEARRFGEA